MTNSAICDECLGVGEFKQVCVDCHGTGLGLTDESPCTVCHSERVAVQECPNVWGQDR
ncbi:hypothetical protein [Xenorhabdus sp. BG5]|uniref:hypothetical protein n=1 Tax=Xenorhabdus sp. BG5 TaxID=2782014 RepID=UPI00188036F4|nr:hypothetical protein [Xenorhabdus sp. BG5]MBE8598005.1 hypothetical protein [Xenorhabdus sp. BG5]